MPETIVSREVYRFPRASTIKPGMIIPADNLEAAQTQGFDIALLMASQVDDLDNLQWLSSPPTPYMSGNVVTYQGFWYKSLIDNNNYIPGTDPTKWELVPIVGTGIIEYKPGVYPWRTVLVYRNVGTDAEPIIQNYALHYPTRPFVSTNFAVEQSAGYWKPYPDTNEQIWSGPSHSTVEVGNMPAGTLLSGRTLMNIMIQILTSGPFISITADSDQYTVDTTTLYKVDTTNTNV